MTDNENTNGRSPGDDPFQNRHPDYAMSDREREIAKIQQAIEKEYEAQRAASGNGRVDAPGGKGRFINDDECTSYELRAKALLGYYDAIDYNDKLFKPIHDLENLVNKIVKSLETSFRKVADEKSKGLVFIGGEEVEMERMLSVAYARARLVQMITDADMYSAENVYTFADLLENIDAVVSGSMILVKPSAWNKSFILISNSIKLADTPFSDAAEALGKKGVFTFGDLKLISEKMDKLKMIEYLREVTGYGLAQAKYFYEIVNMLPHPPLKPQNVSELDVLVAKLNTTVAAVRKILQGSTEKIESIKKLKDALGISLADAKALYDAL